jgi:hypothetical protein
MIGDHGHPVACKTIDYALRAFEVSAHAVPEVLSHCQRHVDGRP